MTLLSQSRIIGDTVLSHQWYSLVSLVIQFRITYDTTLFLCSLTLFLTTFCLICDKGWQGSYLVFHLCWLEFAFFFIRVVIHIPKRLAGKTIVLLKLIPLIHNDTSWKSISLCLAHLYTITYEWQVTLLMKTWKTASTFFRFCWPMFQKKWLYLCTNLVQPCRFRTKKTYFKTR